MFKMPLREIERQFTLSELVITAWRSQEVYHQMTHKLSKGQERTDVDHEDVLERLGQVEEDTYPLVKRRKPKYPFDVPKKLLNEEGEIDLRRATGPEAYAFLAAQGMKLPIIVPTEK